jgi:hypothetical protein
MSQKQVVKLEKQSRRFAVLAVEQLRQVRGYGPVVEAFAIREGGKTVGAGVVTK